MTTGELYADLTRRLSDLTAIEETLGILQWDQEIVMPKGAVHARGRQKATLAGLLHQNQSSAALGGLLQRLGERGDLDDIARANVREAHRDHARAARIPEALVRRWASLTVQAHDVWVEARKAAAFGQFEPVLGEMVDLAKQRAAAIDPGRPAYDVLIDEFEVGMTMARLDGVFAELKATLVPLIARVRARMAQGGLPDASWLRSPVPAERQREVGESMVRAMGFDFDRGRLDTSVHPFCGGAGTDDVRITTRYKETAFLGSLSGMIHETGHALYEQGRDRTLGDQPVSRARSMGIHESQSLLWEKQVGQGAAFWRPHYPRLQAAYAFLAAVSFDDFVFGLNLVQLGNFIRVDADELTYPLHVILRYEIERDLFSGALAVADLPAAWNAKMVQYLGIEPPDAALGCLQDVHWSSGSFGYFPSYTLGAVYAAQFMQAARKAVDVEATLGAGDVQPLLGWLREHVHRMGSRFPTDELVARATGRPLDTAPFRAYVTEKYSRLYRL
ncbi:MAG: carboxypeptidase M32 [Deltaproteobacteria bacterium]|nr:carboxypeptidase M32 [Deltaproteobacteria bacterium]